MEHKRKLQSEATRGIAREESGEQERGIEEWMRDGEAGGGQLPVADGSAGFGRGIRGREGGRGSKKREKGNKK